MFPCCPWRVGQKLSVRFRLLSLLRWAKLIFWLGCYGDTGPRLPILRKFPYVAFVRVLSIEQDASLRHVLVDEVILIKHRSAHNMSLVLCPRRNPASLPTHQSSPHNRLDETIHPRLDRANPRKYQQCYTDRVLLGNTVESR